MYDSQHMQYCSVHIINSEPTNQYSKQSNDNPLNNNKKNKQKTTTLLSVRSEHYSVFLGASFCTPCIILSTVIMIPCTQSINPYTRSIIKCAGNLTFLP